jgi:demethylmenaquinone methyltransferase/2-methoxy-6-polyprenyl-1,4-benzoquinol methylase
MSEPSAKPGSPVRPHAPLPGYYGPDEERTGYVNRLFDEAAPHYEWINRMMSLGSGEAYRRMALERAGLRPGMRLLDIASGTGLVLRPAARIVGPTGGVVGLDPSAGMLGESRAIEPRPLVQARGETLPFPSQSFDFVSLGYGLRHMADLRILFGECFRVLRQTGRMLVLEFARPRSGVTLSLSRFYLKSLVPFLTRIGTSSPAAEQVMRYCWDTVNERVPSEFVLDAMKHAGFTGTVNRRVFGVFVEFSGKKATD